MTAQESAKAWLEAMLMAPAVYVETKKAAPDEGAASDEQPSKRNHRTIPQHLEQAGCENE